MFEKPWQGGQPGSSPAPNVTIGARELIEAAPDILFACDEHGRFQWLNAAVESHLGKRPADLLGRSFLDLVPEGGRKEAARFYVRQNREQVELTSCDLVLEAEQGAATTFSTRVRRVIRPDGDVLFVGCARPAAASAPAAAGSAGASAGFAGPYGGGIELSTPDEWAGGNPAVGAGTLAPDPSTVPVVEGDAQDLSLKLAAARNEAELKSDFLNTMSQEIRAPMNGILGMTQLLLETELDPDQRSFIEVIQNSSQSLLNMVNDTISFTKAEGDNLDVQVIDFDLRHALEEVASLVAPMANERGLGFDCRVSHEAPSPLRGDPALIRQVVLNLANAAIRLTESGHVGINAERTHEDDSRVSLRFTIQDTGLTLEDPEIAKVFEAWSTPDLSNARRHGAAGMALGLARKIVESMGGEVGATTSRSGDGQGGTKFWFRLPLEKQLSEAPAEVDGVDVQMRGQRILVVDPSAESRDQTAGMLTAWGCVPECVPNHSEALTTMRRAVQEGNPFAMAMIEMQLPEVDGEGLGRIIRDDASLNDTRLMLMTSAGSRGDADRVREVGFSAYLVRPIAWSALYDAFVQVMKRPAVTGEPRGLVTRHSVAEARRSRVRVLLVDSNPVNSLVAQSVIKRLGFAVETATTGKDAIAAAENGQYDLILMDLQMPDIDGLQTTAALRARERGHQHTPVVAMTSTANAAERKRCMDAGMDEYLTKPLDLGQLAGAVERFTGNPAPQPLEAADVESIDISVDTDAANEEAPAAETPAEESPAPAEAPEMVLTDADGSAREMPALNTSRLEDSCMGIPALRETLLKAFLSDVRPRLDTLREHVEQNQARRAEFEAHGLRGMCATVGADACRAAFTEIEDCARGGDLSNAMSLIERAAHEVGRAEEYIRRFEEISKRAA